MRIPKRSALLLALLSLAFAIQAEAQMPAAKPETLGFSSERLARIATALDEQIAKDALPGGVLLIAREGKIVHFQAYGYADARKSKPLARDAIFRIASMTKPIVTTTAMMLVEQGRFLLSDPIAKYLPEFTDMKVEAKKADGSGYEVVPAARPITIQDLMRHTSGFMYRGSLGPDRDGLRQAYAAADIEGQTSNIVGAEMLKRLAAIPLAHQPGTTFEYGVSVDVLGLLLERVTGKPLDKLVEEMVLTPLKMRDSTFRLPRAKFGRLADALDSDPLKASTWKWMRVTEDNGDRYMMGGAGMVSTAVDYARFCQMIANGGELDGVRLLSPKTVALMTANHLQGMAGSTAPNTGPGYGFGLGFAVRLQEGMAVVPGNTGDVNWSGACGTTFTIDPKEKLVAVFMAQAPSTRFQMRFLFKDLVYGAMIK